MLTIAVLFGISTLVFLGAYLFAKHHMKAERIVLVWLRVSSLISAIVFSISLWLGVS